MKNIVNYLFPVNIDLEKYKEIKYNRGFLL